MSTRVMQNKNSSKLWQRLIDSKYSSLHILFYIFLWLIVQSNQLSKIAVVCDFLFVD